MTPTTTHTRHTYIRCRRLDCYEWGHPGLVCFPYRYAIEQEGRVADFGNNGTCLGFFVRGVDPLPPARDNPSFFSILPCILDLSRLALDADTPRSCFCTFVACERPRSGTAGVSVVMGLDLML